MRHKICIFGSARTSQIHDCLLSRWKKDGSLFLGNFNKPITIISHPSAIEEIKKFSGIKEIIPYDKPRFSLRSFGWKLFWSIRRKKFSELIICYSTPEEVGYLGLEILSKLLCKRVLAYTFAGEWKRITWWRIAIKIMLLATLPIELLIHRVLLLISFIYMMGRRK